MKLRFSQSPLRTLLGRWLAVATLLSIASCNNANPGEPFEVDESEKQGAVASGELVAPRASKYLKCTCIDLINANERAEFPHISNEAERRQERCHFLAAPKVSNAEPMANLTISVARVLTRNSLVHAQNKAKSAIKLDLSEDNSKPNPNEDQSVITGGDGTYDYRTTLVYLDQQGVLINIEEAYPTTQKFTFKNKVPSFLGTIKDSYTSVCE
jgi:hypothetical protein